jgi:hypothetical protein
MMVRRRQDPICKFFTRTPKLTASFVPLASLFWLLARLEVSRGTIG